MFSNNLAKCIVNKTTTINSNTSLIHFKSFKNYCNDLLLSFSTYSSSTNILNDTDSINNNNKNSNNINNNDSKVDLSKTTIFKQFPSKKKIEITPLADNNNNKSEIFNRIINNYTQNRASEARRLLRSYVISEVYKSKSLQNIDHIFDWVIKTPYIETKSLNYFLNYYISIKNIGRVEKVLNCYNERQLKYDLRTFDLLLKFDIACHANHSQIKYRLEQLAQSELDYISDPILLCTIIDAMIFVGDAESALTLHSTIIMPKHDIKIISHSISSLLRYQLENNNNNNSSNLNNIKNALDFLSDQLRHCTEFIISKQFISFFKICINVGSPHDQTAIELVKKYIYSVPAEQRQEIGILLLGKQSTVEVALDLYGSMVGRRVDLDKFHLELLRSHKFDFTATYLDIVEQWLLRQDTIHTSVLLYLFGNTNYSPSHQMLSVLRENLDQVAKVIAHGELANSKGVSTVMEMLEQSSQDIQKQVIERVIMLHLHLGKINRVLHWRQKLDTPSSCVDYLLAKYNCKPAFNPSQPMLNYWKLIMRDRWQYTGPLSGSESNEFDDVFNRLRNELDSPYDNLFRMKNSPFNREPTQDEQDLMKQLSELSFSDPSLMRDQVERLTRLGSTLDRICTQEWITLNFSVLLQAMNIIFYTLQSKRQDFKDIWSRFSQKTKYWLYNPNHYVTLVDIDANSGIEAVFENLSLVDIKQSVNIKNVILENMVWDSSSKIDHLLKWFQSIDPYMVSERCHNALTQQIIDEQLYMDRDSYERFKLTSNSANSIFTILDCWYAMKSGDIQLAEHLFLPLRDHTKKRAAITKLGFQIYVATRPQPIDIIDLMAFIGVTKTFEFYDALLPALMKLPTSNKKMLDDIIGLDSLFYRIYHTSQTVEVVVNSATSPVSRINCFRKFVHAPKEYSKEFVQLLHKDLKEYAQSDIRLVKYINSLKINQKKSILNSNVNYNLKQII